MSRICSVTPSARAAATGASSAFLLGRTFHSGAGLTLQHPRDLFRLPRPDAARRGDAETDPAEADHDTVIRNFLTGQYGNALRVIRW
jgi:hypothetical protein